MPIEAPARGESQRQGVRTALIWLLVAPWAVWAFARVLGLEAGPPFVQLIAFTPYVAATALIPLAVSLVTRQWWAAGVAGLVGISLALCVIPRMVGSPSTMDGVKLTVMSMNMLEGGASAQNIVDLVRSRHVDVLTVQEFTPGAQRRLANAGLGTLLPYQQLHPVESTPGSGLYSRFPITDADTHLNEGSFFQAFATVHPPGAQPVQVYSVHPVAPAESSMVGPWADDLGAEPPATPDGPLRILAGDFNATLDHAVLRRIIGTGYDDAAAEVGAGLAPTWPYYGPRATVTPKVTIDHVLVDRRVGVRDFAVYPVARTDHHAIVTDVVLPRA